MELYKLKRIVYECPKCGRTYDDSGKHAEDALNASYITCECGFNGEIRDW